MYESIPDKAYDAYVMLMNFDKLLKQECPYIEIEKERYYQDGICHYNKLICTRLPICSQALITAQKEDESYGN